MYCFFLNGARSAGFFLRGKQEMGAWQSHGIGNRAEANYTINKKKRGGRLDKPTFRSSFIKCHTKGCDETPTKYRIWGRHNLCNPPAVKHLAVEARHWLQHFARHFIKKLKSIPIYFDVDNLSRNASFFNWHGKGTSFLSLMQYLERYLTLLFLLMTRSWLHWSPKKHLLPGWFHLIYTYRHSLPSSIAVKSWSSYKTRHHPIASHCLPLLMTILWKSLIFVGTTKNNGNDILVGYTAVN